MIRVALTADGDIEATVFNPDSPRYPHRVVVDCRSPGNVIAANVKEGSDHFRRLVVAARKHVAP